MTAQQMIREMEKEVKKNSNLTFGNWFKYYVIIDKETNTFVAKGETLEELAQDFYK